MSKPVVHLFHLGVDEKNRDSFYQVGMENFQTSYKEEAGTLAMYASSLRENQLEYKVFEIYADKAAYQTHVNSPHFKVYVDQVGSKLTKREVFEVEALFLEEKLPSGVWLGPEHHFLKFAQVQVREGSQEAFENSVLINMQTSIKEEVGVLAMYAVKDSQQSNRYYFYEVYASAKAYEDHRLTPHFQRYISETQDLVEEKNLQDLENSMAISKGQLAFSS
ncbi:putative quinol monooxygenase [Streptococcus suis]|uniref:putative quinol monooxygenase n=1 Tax=Streptococcus suis TaxID=1307 RepID=UPI00114701B1|nr:antibiotic biosynthesis monooxygenase [Streptococcus suis]MCH1638278.1 antibiotic biosynthesis monooxygenase [Streptococcus suis]MCH1649107.1 antibiotic biosynthesis monooxygenase [Streptococcus suis]TQE47092.1 antibiotic biosynthesis monooxygenase [Streptococcus suis]HEM3072701.1 antibiotic biosynthesis monooxygenase [Streptococcus suis]HEM3090764.1 antibiotic biosynthesis monooxygenase [Streptococcus suis]